MSIEKSVKVGHVEIEIRKFSDGRFGYDWYDAGKQKKGRWRSLDDAITAARARAKALSVGRTDLLDVTPLEWSRFQEWKAEGITKEEWEEFRAWKVARTKSKSVVEVRNELLRLKNEDGDLDPIYLTNLKGAWKLFCDTFGARNMVDIEPSEIEGWLRGLNKQPRNRNNIRDLIVQLFRFARERKYLPFTEATAAEQVKRLTIKSRSDDIEIWSPADLRAILAHVRPQFKPWVLLGGFAGIRTNEIRPRPKSHKDCLRWEDFQWAEKQICVRAEVSKTGRTRYTPMADNLAAWLAEYRERTGPVIVEEVHVMYEEMTRVTAAISKERLAAEKGGFESKKNALRHSYGSYRNAIIRNIGQLADEMGNSPAIAKKNYERPQPKAIAEEWFAIMPETKPAPTV